MSVSSCFRLNPRSSEDRVGVALEALEYALKTGAKLNGIIFKYGGFAYLVSSTFRFSFTEKIGTNTVLMS